MKVSVNIDDEEFRKLVLDDLKISYKHAKEDMLNYKDAKQPCLQENYKNSKKMEKHLRKVILYYMTPSEKKEWLDA